MRGILLQPLRAAFRNFSVARGRTALTVLGIVIGIAAVFFVLSIGASAKRLVLDQVRGVGSNLIGVLPGASDEKGPPASVFGIVTTTLVPGDLEAIADGRSVPHVISAAGYVTGSAIATARSESFAISYQGVSATLPEIESVEVAEGRFFTTDEDASLARVAVLGSDRVRDLFGGDDPIGKRFSLRDTTFVVVGVLEERGSVAFSNPNQAIYIPLATAQKLLLGIDHLNFIRVKVDDEKNLKPTVADIRMLLRDRHDLRGDDPDDFSVRNTADAVDILSGITDVLTYFLAAVAGISLFVGGIGIMNIMLISVRQRIREVGLKKAVGARDTDIFRQFIVEAAFLAVIGGAIGFVVGVILTFLVALGVRAAGYEWEFILTWDAAGIAFGISLAVGIFFGLSPARRAARISPMEALRYE